MYYSYRLDTLVQKGPIASSVVYVADYNVVVVNIELQQDENRDDARTLWCNLLAMASR